MTTKIALLRHAETAAPELFHGFESDIGLGPRGFEQARAVAALLAPERPDALYCSGMRRARETAQAIAEATGLAAKVVEPLHERKMGPLSGTTWAESRHVWEDSRSRWIAGDLDATHPGGESFADVRDRVVPAFQAIVDREEGRSIVVVAHGVVIKVLMTTLIDGLSPADLDRIEIGFAQVHRITKSGGRLLAGDLDFTL